MMSNIFSIFDPATSLNLSMNWLSPIIIFFLAPLMYWYCPSRYTFSWYTPLKFILKEFKILIKYSYSNLIIFYCLFSTILFNNFMGLFPHVFTSTSHPSFCLPTSLSLCLAMILYSLFNYFNDLCTHLTPQGTPTPLMPFMVAIESISFLIRPVTLSVRLTANMIAGHLLLSLIGSTGPLFPMFISLPITLPTQTLLFILEIAMTMIQAYVFSILTTLYSSEV